MPKHIQNTVDSLGILLPVLRHVDAALGSDAKSVRLFTPSGVLDTDALWAAFKKASSLDAGLTLDAFIRDNAPKESSAAIREATRLKGFLEGAHLKDTPSAVLKGGLDREFAEIRLADLTRRLAVGAMCCWLNVRDERRRTT